MKGVACLALSKTSLGQVSLRDTACLEVTPKDESKA